MHREHGQGQQNQDEPRGEAALVVLVAPVVDGGGGRSGVSESAGAARRPEDAGGRFAEVAERGRRGVRRVSAVAVETSLLIANLARLLEGPLLTLLLVGIVAPCLLSAGDGKRSAEENGKIWGKYPFAIVYLTVGLTVDVVALSSLPYARPSDVPSPDWYSHLPPRRSCDPSPPPMLLPPDQVPDGETPPVSSPANPTSTPSLLGMESSSSFPASSAP